MSDDWLERAACRHAPPALFFPELEEGDRRGQSLSYSGARAYCRTCPVKRPCLEYALENDIRFGMFGGTKPSARVRIRQRRRREAREAS